MPEPRIYEGPVGVTPDEFRVLFERLVLQPNGVSFRLELIAAEAIASRWMLEGTAPFNGGFFATPPLVMHHMSNGAIMPVSLRLNVDLANDEHCTVTAFLTGIEKSVTWKLHGTLDRLGVVEDD
ncbi:hypothetical protein ACO2Q9_03280 [Variovorax sp. VNK109]|uniref:hypothetical protein n=1 Tax=Variovorax sp. VNK109 TaxID=3400919 RepID=UPI003C02FFDC